MNASPYEVVKTGLNGTVYKTHLVCDKRRGCVLGAFGSNTQRQWVYPLYTPKGHQVLREYPFDHAPHNGIFVGQRPIRWANRTITIWHYGELHPKRETGRVIADDKPTVSMFPQGIRFEASNTWVDFDEHPAVAEQRRVDLYQIDDATICDVWSTQRAAYGRLEYPQSQHGSIGVRVEDRFLPALGGRLLSDHGMGQEAAINHSGSTYVAFESELTGMGVLGICVMPLTGAPDGPWYVRDYGMAMLCPTQYQPIIIETHESWTVGLRVIAYDDPLDADRLRSWSGLSGMETLHHS
jgi:hypothetical protein